MSEFDKEKFDAYLEAKNFTDETLLEWRNALTEFQTSIISQREKDEISSEKFSEMSMIYVDCSNALTDIERAFYQQQAD